MIINAPVVAWIDENGQTQLVSNIEYLKACQIMVVKLLMWL